MMEPIFLAVIGGSGVYEMEALQDVEERRIETPFGPPSDVIVLGTLAGRRVAFLSRHGRGHRLMPTEVNSRANIWALKSLGVTRILSINACGSLREDLPPRHVIIPDQLVDWTRRRPLSFFGDGLVAHIAFDTPFCPHLSELLYQAVQEAGGQVTRGGRFIIIEGPRFSTRAESHLYRQWGMDIIGMTIVPEAQLAREAEMCYVSMANVTDYDCWHQSEEPVNVQMLLDNLAANAALAKRTVQFLVPKLPPPDAERDCLCARALEIALITRRDLIPPETRQRLEIIVGKYL